jgi:hypothetical protein
MQPLTQHEPSTLSYEGSVSTVLFGPFAFRDVLLEWADYARGLRDTSLSLSLSLSLHVCVCAFFHFHLRAIVKAYSIFKLHSRVLRRIDVRTPYAPVSHCSNLNWKMMRFLSLEPYYLSTMTVCIISWKPVCPLDAYAKLRLASNNLEYFSFDDLSP